MVSDLCNAGDLTLGCREHYAGVNRFRVYSILIKAPDMSVIYFLLHLGSMGNIKLATCSHCAYTRMKRPQEEEVRAQCVSLNNSGSKDETMYVLGLLFATIRNCLKDDEKTSGCFPFCCVEPQRFKTREVELHRRFHDGAVPGTIVFLG